jgi:phospholipid/cholesterol/gamma-HCH transport system substrate-binding protein
MNKTVQSFNIGLFFILGLVLIYFVYEALNNKNIGRQKGYTIVASFDHLRQISPGDPVRIAGVKTGNVKNVGLDSNGKASITLQINYKHKIPKDSVATINLASLMGNNYIEIFYGSPKVGFLKDQDTIETKESVAISSIINNLEELLTEEVSLFFANLNKVFEKDSKVDRILANIDTITQGLKNGEGTIGKLLKEETVYNQLTELITDLETTVNNALSLLRDGQEMIAYIKKGQGTMGRIIYEQDLADQIDKIVANVIQFTEKLNTNKTTLGRIITDDELYMELKDTLKKANRAIDSLGDSGPITAIGVLTNALF